MDEFPDDAATMIQNHIEGRGSFLAWIGGEIEELSRERSVILLPHHEHLNNGAEPPLIHGGVTATLVDVTGSLALRPHFDDPYRDSVATINLNVNYLQGATGDLRAVGEVIRSGSTVGVSRVRVEEETEDGENDLTAVGQGAYRVFPADREGI